MMSIANYAELQTAISAWSHRTVSQVTDFIKLAETRINSRLSSRLAEVDATLTATAGSRYITLPSGFISPYALWREYPVGTRTKIIYVESAGLNPNTASDSFPSYYTIDGTSIAFDYPNIEDFTYILRYKKGYDIATTLTNDILTNYPDVYLLGGLFQSSLFARDYAAADRFKLEFNEAIESCLISESQNKSNAILSFDTPMTGTKTNIYDGGF